MPTAQVVPVFDRANGSLFFSRNDSSDPRLGDLVKALPTGDSPGHSFSDLEDALVQALSALSQDRLKAIIAGYPDDEGIRVNGGRTGAALGPTEIRRVLYKMTPALLAANQVQILDAGDLHISARTLAERHEVARNAVSMALRSGCDLWIGLGGGHDYGYADAAGFCDWCQTQGVRPLVVNFDAHLDVRPIDRGLSSGTPFFRMLETFSNVDFLEIGIQGHCNSRKHLQWLQAKGARVLMQEELEASGEPMATAIVRTMGDWLLKRRPVFLSIDIDGFSSAVAPGCSQSWATGFTPEAFFPTLNLLAHRLDLKVLGIYEVAPPLDHDMRTAKLAAQIVHRSLFCNT